MVFKSEVIKRSRGLPEQIGRSVSAGSGAFFEELKKQDEVKEKQNIALEKKKLKSLNNFDRNFANYAKYNDPGVGTDPDAALDAEEAIENGMDDRDAFKYASRKRLARLQGEGQNAQQGTNQQGNLRGLTQSTGQSLINSIGVQKGPGNKQSHESIFQYMNRRGKEQQAEEEAYQANPETASPKIKEFVTKHPFKTPAAAAGGFTRLGESLTDLVEHPFEKAREKLNLPNGGEFTPTGLIKKALGYSSKKLEEWSGISKLPPEEQKAARALGDIATLIPGGSIVKAAVKGIQATKFAIPFAKFLQKQAIKTGLKEAEILQITFQQAEKSGIDLGLVSMGDKKETAKLLKQMHLQNQTKQITHQKSPVSIEKNISPSEKSRIEAHGSIGNVVIENPETKRVLTKISKEENPTTSATQRTHGETPKYHRYDEAVAREEQLLANAKHEEEVLSEVADKAARDLEAAKEPARESTKIARLGNIERWQSELPVKRAIYERALKTKRALEDAAVLAKDAKQKAMLEGRLSIATKEVTLAEDALKQNLKSIKEGKLRTNMEQHIEGSRNLVIKVGEEAQAGEVKLSKTNYNPEMIKKAKSIEKMKKLPGEPKNDFYNRVHREYIDTYKQRLNQVNQELKGTSKGLADVESKAALRREKDALEKMIDHAEAEITIHNRKLQLRNLNKRATARERLGKAEHKKELSATEKKTHEIAAKVEGDFHDYMKNPTKENLDKIINNAVVEIKIEAQEAAIQAKAEAEKAAKIAAEKARKKAMDARKTKQEAEKAARDAFEKSKLDAEKAAQEAVEKAKIDAEKAAEKAKIDAKEAFEKADAAQKAWEAASKKPSPSAWQDLKTSLKQLNTIRKNPFAKTATKIVGVIMGSKSLKFLTYGSPVAIATYAFTLAKDKYEKENYKKALRSPDTRKQLELKSKYSKKIVKQAEEELRSERISKKK